MMGLNVMPNDNEAKKVIALTALAREKDIRPRTLIRAARAGDLPVVTIGARLFTTREAAERYFTPRPLAESRT